MPWMNFSKRFSPKTLILHLLATGVLRQRCPQQSWCIDGTYHRLATVSLHTLYAWAYFLVLHVHEGFQKQAATQVVSRFSEKSTDPPIKTYITAS